MILNTLIFTVLSVLIVFSTLGYGLIFTNKIFQNNQYLNLSIKEIKKESNPLNNDLSNALLKILSNNKSDNVFDLEIQSNKFTEIRSKDSKGNASVYVFKLETKIIVTDNNNREYKNIFNKEMNYSENDDKFELSQYLNQIEKILINETVEEIIGYLIDLR